MNTENRRKLFRVIGVILMWVGFNVWKVTGGFHWWMLGVIVGSFVNAAGVYDPLNDILKFSTLDCLRMITALGMATFIFVVSVISMALCVYVAANPTQEQLRLAFGSDWFYWSYTVCIATLILISILRKEEKKEQEVDSPDRENTKMLHHETSM